jgi:hypothetical protein
MVMQMWKKLSYAVLAVNFLILEMMYGYIYLTLKVVYNEKRRSQEDGCCWVLIWDTGDWGWFIF